MTLLLPRYTNAWGCGALLVVMSMGQALCKAPLIRIIELNLCRSYYQIHDPNVIDPNDYVDEQFCKIIPVQKELAIINAYNIVFLAIIELLTAFPYASLCERYDRRTILLVNVASAFAALFHTMCICYFYQTFSTKMIWLQCLYRICGGGDSVMLSLTNALIAETVPSANLSKILFGLNATRLFVNAASQTAGAYLMPLTLWLPVLVGLSVHCFTIPALFLIMDPRYRSNKSSKRTAPAAGASDPLLGSSSPATANKQDPESPSKSFRHAFRVVLFLWRDPIAAPTLAVFFTNELGHGVNNIVQQWVSKSFSWPLASTNYFLSAQRVVAGVTLILLSTTVHRLQAAGIASRRIDVGIVWFCQTMTLLGIFGAALSSSVSSKGRRVQFLCSVLVYMMGWGMNGALQSSVTRVSDKTRITWLYTGLNVAERMAAIVGGPIFADLLAEGLRREGQWVFLPYWVSGGIFVVVLGLTLRLTRLLARL